MKKEIVSMFLEKMPPDVNKIIRNEQLRLELHEKQDLKKPYVIYKIVREWFSFRKDTK